MGLRQDFLIHEGKTIESFRLVRADISGIHTNAGHMNNRLASVESAVSALDSHLSNLQKSIERLSSEISLEQENSSLINSKISGISNSVEKSQKMSKVQALRNKQFSSLIKAAQDGIKKLKTLVERRLNAVNKKNIELEAKLKKLSGKKSQAKKIKK